MKKIIVAILFIASPAYAQSLSLGEINVIETKEDNVSSLVSSDALFKEQVMELKDVFKNEKEVIVGGGIGAAQKIYYRGVEDTNLNISIEGARQNSYLFHHQGKLNLDPELIKRVEVKGSGALAGPGALGGSVKMTLKDPSDYLGENQNFGGYLKLKTDSVSSGTGEVIGLMGKKKIFEYLVIFNNEDHKDYKDGGGNKVEFSDTYPVSLLSKFIIKRNDFEKISLSYDRRENNSTRRLRNHFGHMPEDRNPPSNQEFITDNVSLNYDYAGVNPFLNFHVNLFSSSNFIRRYGGSDSETKWVTTGSDINNTFLFNSSQYVLGFDTTFNHSYAQSAGNNKEVGEILGIYQDYSYQLYSWELGVGARYDHYKLEDPFKNTYSQNRISPSAKLSKNYLESFKASLSYSEGFKGLVPMESIMIANAKGISTPTEKLKGTTSQSIEFTNSYIKEKTSVVLSLYQTEFKNMMDASVDRGTGIIKRENGKNLKTKGYSIELTQGFGTHIFRANFSHNKITYDGDPLGYVAFNKGSSHGDRLNLSMEKIFMDNDLSVKLSSLFVSKMDDVPVGARKHKGYELVDLYLNYNINKEHHFGVALTNIFDREYISHSTPYIVSGDETTLKEPGRSLKLSYSYFF